MRATHRVLLRRTLAFATVALLGVLVAGPAIAEETSAAKQMASPAHVIMAPKDLKWGAVPPSLPKGAKLAVIQGDPAASGEVVTLRLKMPKGYLLPPHFHPTDEAVTVISGAFNIGMGDKVDRKAAKPLGPGGWAVLPKSEHHYAFATADSVVQVHMIGPFAITYVNPADDPQAKAGQ
jgi:hypothetical protein